MTSGMIPTALLEAPSRAHRVVELSKWMREICSALGAVCTPGEICNALDAASKMVADGQHKKRKGANGKGSRP